MNDSETVALIGGGHAFGKTHGACATGAGPGPKQQPDNPWPGTCGEGPMKGRGPNTFTSGFEGAWTTKPTQWDNEYFRNLLKFDWEKHKGPGGHWQWRPKHKAGSTGKLPDIMMLTADIALLKDPIYLKLVQHYASNLAALTEDFKNAWYKLMTRSMGPVTRCLGSQVAPPQAFQLPLPAPSGAQPDWKQVKSELAALVNSPSRDQLASLAYQCASTFRATDFAGGCNGARIRFSPQKDWPGNKGLVEPTLKELQAIKDRHPNLSFADLIVLAGTMAVEAAAGQAKGSFGFCPGRTDARDAAGTEHLAPRSYGGPEIAFKDGAAVHGLTPGEAVALAARPRSPAYAKLQGLSGSWTTQPSPPLSNAYFKLLLNLPWSAATSSAGKPEFRASAAAAAQLLAAAPGKTAAEAGAKQADGYVFMSPQDLVIKNDPALASIAREYAADNAKFVRAFRAAWGKLMNADRFDGPAGNVCSKAV